MVFFISYKKKQHQLTDQMKKNYFTLKCNSYIKDLLASLWTFPVNRTLPLIHRIVVWSTYLQNAVGNKAHDNKQNTWESFKPILSLHGGVRVRQIPFTVKFLCVFDWNGRLLILIKHNSKRCLPMSLAFLATCCPGFWNLLSKNNCFINGEIIYFGRKKPGNWVVPWCCLCK